jgi:hypothetical protein
MRRAMVITVLLFFPASAFTQQQESLDLESLVGDVDELGVPTVSKVQALRESAEALAEGGDCEAAIPALESWAKAANQLANFLRIGLDPFYDASRDDRDAFRRTAGKNFKKYVEIEGQANGYLRQRNTAMVFRPSVRRGWVTSSLPLRFITGFWTLLASTRKNRSYGTELVKGCTGSWAPKDRRHENHRSSLPFVQKCRTNRPNVRLSPPLTSIVRARRPALPTITAADQPHARCCRWPATRRVAA